MRGSRLGAATVAAALAIAVVSLGAAPPPVHGAGVVAADHRLVSAAGAEMLAKGGNAVDAAVAAVLAQGVVQPAGSGLAGGGFAVVSGIGSNSADSYILDFREVAPAAASRDMYLTKEGKVDSKKSQVGGWSVAVPGESRGLWELHAKFGKLKVADVAAPAIRLADQGFGVEYHLANALATSSKGEVGAWFLVGGLLATEGQTLRQPVLAKTLRAWVSTGGEMLHRGKGASAIVDTVTADGGGLSLDDLANYQPVERQPLIGHYRGYTVVTMPPPSSGGVALLEMLGVLEGYDVASLGHNSSDHLHLLTETMKHVFADRAHHLGDPAFVDVPVQRLLSPERAAEIQRAIWPGRTFPTDYYGTLIEPARDAGTAHLSVLDKNGMAVALTTTINTSFGSGLIVDSLGVVLNDQMDDFSAAPGVPNAFGLVGNEANAIAPGKRPLSSMSPTMLLDKDGHVVMVVGASGGSQIISGVVQAISNVVDFQMDASEAVSAPRVHHQWQPDQLVVEPGIPKDVLDALRARGHTVQVSEHYSCVQLISDTTGTNQAASDPRKGGTPVGVW